jgi:hypothetical protein
MLHLTVARIWYLRRCRNPHLPRWLRCTKGSVPTEIWQALLTALALSSSPIFCPWGQRRVQDVYSLLMDLVFIYLSITVFVFVLVLKVSSLLPPTGLTPALTCDPHSLWTLPLFQMQWGGEPGMTRCGNVHLGRGSPVRIWLLPQPGTGLLDSWKLKPHKYESWPLAAEIKIKGLVCF